MSNINIVQWISQGFGGGAPNKLKASAEGRGASFASDPCRRHGRKLVGVIWGVTIKFDYSAATRAHNLSRVLPRNWWGHNKMRMY